MILDKIKIKNFQPFKDTTIELATGLNVFKGTSHIGKSSIIRAIKWVLQNKPQGFGYRSNFADKKEATVVSLFFPDSEVVRRRDSKENCYEVNGNKLEAMRSDVPDVVQAALQMNEVNLRTQFEGFFLLQNTAGEVAKKLNEYAGLEIIDVSLSKVNRLLSVAKKYYEEKNSQLDANKILLGGLPYIDGMERALNKVIVLEQTLEEKREKLKVAEVLLSQWQVVEGNIRDESAWQKDILPRYKKTVAIAEEYYKAEEKFSQAVELLEELDYCTKKMRRMNSEALVLEKQFHKKLSDNKICPLCGKKI